MPARSGLADLILQLRGLTDAGSADYTLGTANFWDDDHLQQALDRHRVDVRREQLAPQPTYGAGGTPIYQDYASEFINFEATSAGTAVFVVEDGAGVDQGTALWSADYSRGIVSFAANTLGTAYYVTGRSYDLYAAAADVWRTKAAQSAKVFDVSTDNHSLSRSQIMKQALEMADYYASMSAPSVTTLYRSDC